MPGPAVLMLPSQGNDLAAFEKSANRIKRKIYRGKAQIIRTRVWLENTYDPLKNGHEPRFVSYMAQGGNAIELSSLTNLSTFIVMSHAGPFDGPNMTFGVGGHHPWGRYEGTRPDPKESKFYKPYQSLYGGTSKERTAGDSNAPITFRRMQPTFRIDMLRPRAREFWQTIGDALRPGGKIILLGCKAGAPGQYGDVSRIMLSYAQHVANASGKTTFAATTYLAAASPTVSTQHVSSIEDDGEVFSAASAAQISRYGVMKRFQPMTR